MISGAHIILCSKDAEADRRFFRDVLGFKSVDAGHGWLIFALPPAEAAFHPAEESGAHELYLMCDDVKAEIAALRSELETFKAAQPDQGAISKMIIECVQSAFAALPPSPAWSWASSVLYP